MPTVLSFFGDPFSTPNGTVTLTPTISAQLVAVCVEDGASTTGGTYADNGADASTWTKLLTAPYSGGVMTVFFRNLVWTDSTANRSFTYTSSGLNTRCTNYIWQIGGMTINGSFGIIQSSVSAGSTGVNPSIVMPSVPNPANLMLAMATQNAASPSPTQTAPTGFSTEGNETDAVHFSTQFSYKLNIAPQTITFGSSSSVAWSVAAAELTEIAAGSLIADATPDKFATDTVVALVGLGLGPVLIPAPPIITIVTSLPPATASTPIVITVVPGGTNPIRKAWMDFHFPGIIGTEVIYNGVNFGAYYTNPTNTRTSLSNGGYQFTILRDGGWPVGAFPLASSLDAFAVDTTGNSTIP